VKFGRRGVFYWLLRVAERLTFSVADVVISTNESYREIALGRGRVNPDRVFIVKSAPDLAEYTAPSSHGPRAGDGCLIGYVGIMAAQDGVDVLIEAAAILLGHLASNGLRFRIIGGGSEENNLRRRARDLGIEESVEFTGYLYGADMRLSLSECDLGVVPDPKNPYNDRCTMNKVLEYMALGLPVVQFDLLESRRSAGDAALYAEGNDAAALAAAIESVCFDAVQLEQMRQAGLDRIGQLQWAVQRESLSAAYECVLERTIWHG
jgi:glycosyltransferase involved in cell wall biosynthesis